MYMARRQKSIRKLSQPFVTSRPSTAVRAPVASLSGSGAAGVAFTVQDTDAPATQSADAVWRRSGAGAPKSYAVPGSKQVLASAFQGGTLQLLTGSAASRPGHRTM